VVDRDLVLAKAGRIERHLRRVREKRGVSLEAFLDDLDRQESILFNLQMAIQGCVDVAAHVIGDEGLGVPGSMNEMFYLLEESGFLDRQITENMVKAVGFRNLIVHEYGKLDLKKVFQVATEDVADLENYLAHIFRKMGFADPGEGC
jgi:uncharacterized protein YutE (UPF0331/DUF86 family)